MVPPPIALSLREKIRLSSQSIRWSACGCQGILEGADIIVSQFYKTKPPHVLKKFIKK